MDPLVYIVGAVIVLILIVAVTFLKRPTSGEKEHVAGPEARGARQRDADRPAAAAARRRGARQRMVAAAARNDDSEEEDTPLDDIAMPEGKVGAKKMAKLQAKAEKRQNREAEMQEREERKQRDAQREEMRKKDDARREQDEKAVEEEDKKRKEEEEAREHEEYLKLKAAFTVDEEGTHEEELNTDTESLLQEFINYIKEMKVVMLEDLAAHFKIKTQDAIDRVQTLLEEERLSGVMDDRGKFIYITQEEYEAVAKFIKQRGRVSLSELASSSNQLVNMNPDNKETMQRLVAGETLA